MVTGENFVEFKELEDPIKIIFNQLTIPIPLRYTNGVDVRILVSENELTMKDKIITDIFTRTEKIKRFLSIYDV